MKIRLQIQLDRDDHDALKSWAASAGISMSGAVRMLVRDKLRTGDNREPAIKRFLSAAGSITELPGEGAVSQEHDRFLYGTRTD